MRIEYRVISISLFFGIVFSIFDAFIDAMLFYDESFIELLFTNVPSHELYMRTLVVICFICFGFIVSSIKTKYDRTASALSMVESKWETVMACNQDQVVVLSSDEYRITYINRSLFDRDPADLLGHVIFDYVNDEQKTVMKECYDHVIATGEPDRYELEFTQKNGEPLFIIANVGPVYSEKGIDSIIVSSADVTQYKKNELLLLQSERRFRNLFENTPLGYQSLDEKGVIIEVNQVWLNLLGYSEDEVIGRYFPIFLTDQSKSEFKKIFQRMKKTRGLHNLEFDMVHSDGSLVSVSMDTRTSRSDEEQLVHTNCIVRDITKRKRIESQLEEIQKRADFLRDLLFHDLNNIHQGILLSIELLLSSESIPVDLRRVLEATLSQTNRANSLISNVRKFVQVDSESIELKEQDLFPIIVSALEAVQVRFPDKEFSVQFKLEEDKISVLSNEYLIDVFYNIIHNAAKLSKSSRVGIEVCSRVLLNDFVSVEISHDGPGVPDSRKSTIFSRLENREDVGFGIGLTLAKLIVDKHGGHIYVDDRVAGDPSKGATFVVILKRYTTNGHQKQEVSSDTQSSEIESE